MELTDKGRDFIKYLKAEKTDNPEYEKTIRDVGAIIMHSKGIQPTRESVVQLLLTMEEKK